MSERITVGDVSILSLSDCVNPIDVHAMFPRQSPEDWDSYRDHVGENGYAKELVNMGSFLIVTEEHRVLVDTGVGPVPHEMFPDLKGDLLDQMRQRDIDRGDIDIVFSTHMHFDHIGWSAGVRDGVVEPTFPNALYVLPRVDWEALFEPDEALRRRVPDDLSEDAIETFLASRELGDRLKQLQNVELVAGDHSITDEIVTVDTPGHTPGHMSLMISSAGERAFVLGDVVHLPVQLDVPERVNGADVHPMMGRKTRIETVEWLEREGLMVAAGHFPAPGFGTVVKGEGRRYWKAG